MNIINKSQQISMDFYKYQLTIDKIFGFAKLLVVNPPCDTFGSRRVVFYERKSFYHN